MGFSGSHGGGLPTETECRPRESTFNRVDNRTHITVTPYIARSFHPTVLSPIALSMAVLRVAPDKHKAVTGQ